MNPAPYISEILYQDSLPGSSYLRSLPVIRYLEQSGTLPLSSNVTFFVGENGTGKSTLLEAIAVAYGFNAEGGSRNFTFSTNDTHSELWQHLTLAKRKRARDGFFLRAESLYNLATDIDERDVIEGYGGISLHRQSHGESFLALVHHRFFGNGLYLLDEPEAALSPLRLLTLMTEINNLLKQDSQFIIATHSPILMTFPGAQLLEFSENGIRQTTYQETEHYKITKRFLDNPQKMLRYLLEED